MNLSGKVDMPVVGSVDKRVLLGVGGVAAVFLGWKYWQSRSAAAYDPEAEAVDPGMEDPGVLPPVSGAIRDNNDYGLSDGSSSGSDSYGFKGTTNSQWTQYAITQLSGASDKWSYADIAEALGQYIANKPLTALQISIVQAAKALAGEPPEGTHPVVPGGDVPMTVAPTGLTATAVDTDSIQLRWNTVAGADSYRIYRSGSTTNIGTSLDGEARIDGLQAGTKYTFRVAAVSAGGKTGPASANASASTKAAVLKAPTGLKVTKRTKSTVSLSWSKVTGASGYRVYHNHSSTNVQQTSATSATVSGLKANYKYKWHIRAVDNNNHTGPASSQVSGYTTK